MKRNLFVHVLIIILICSITLIADNQDIIDKGQLLPVTKIVKSEEFRNSMNRTLIFEEDFEAGFGSWSLSGEWDVGFPTTGPNSGYNSSNCAATDLDGNYSNYSDYWLTSPSLNLGTATEIKLYFWEWFSIESNYDYGRVKVSTNGGSSWTELSSISGSSTWRETEVNLTPYCNETILLAFNFTSDYSVTYSGWYIDDIRIETEEPEPLTSIITSLNSQNFPFIYMNVVVDSMGAGTPNLTQSNFEVHENGVLQSDYYEVTPPNQGGGSRLADIIFLMDNSGSMDEEQNAVENNVIDFVDNLSASGIDFALGLCRYGQGYNNGYPIIEDNGILTTNADYFKYEVWQRNEIDGGNEPGYHAIVESSNNFSFRPGTQKIFIIITDESPDQGGDSEQNAINACIDNSITLFALTESGLFGQFTGLINNTNGACFDIYSNFDDILDYISSQVANTYLVRYRSSDPIVNGIERDIEIVVSYFGEQATATGSYIPGAAPQILRTEETIELHNQAWAENTEFTIEVLITDEIEPLVQSATVFYKTTTESTYQSIAMYQTVRSDIWEGVILGNDVETPGLDYYITVTDGQSTSSDPSVEPSTNPYQIAILPNEAPEINHVPVTFLVPYSEIAVDASVVDNTNLLTSVQLFYRKTGQLTYHAIEMINTYSSYYYGEIPGNYCTTDGVDYFIKSSDDFDVHSFHGTPDEPHQIFIPLNVKLLSISANNENELEVMEGGKIHRYLEIVDETGNPISGLRIKYHLSNESENIHHWSMASDEKGLLDLFIELGGYDANSVYDDWANSEDGLVTISYSDQLSFPGHSPIPIENEFNNFDLIIKDRTYERSWDILLGPEVSVGGTAGSIGVGPVGIAAARLSVRAKGGLGYNLTLMKSSDNEDKLKVSRRAEAGIGGSFSMGKINMIGSFRIGAEGNVFLVGRGEQEYYFDNMYSNEQKMAQAGLLLETLSVGNLPVSPILGIIPMAIVTTLNNLSGADEILDDSMSRWGIQGGIEGELGAGFKTELINSSFSKIANIELPNAESELAIYLGLDRYIESRSFLQARSFRPDNGYKVYLEEAGGVDISLLNLEIENGLPFDIDTHFLPHLGYRGSLEQAGYFDDNWNFLGLGLGFESDNTVLYNAVSHNIQRTEYYVPSEIIEIFVDEINSNASHFAIPRNSSEEIGYAQVGISTLISDMALLIDNSIIEGSNSNESITYDLLQDDANIYEGSIGLDLHIAVGVGLVLEVGANFSYIDSKKYLINSGQLIDTEFGFKNNESYVDDIYTEDNSNLISLVENQITGIWPLITEALESLIDWLTDTIQTGMNWVIGWFGGGRFDQAYEDESWFKIYGNGDELPNNSEIQVSRYSPHVLSSLGSINVYSSNRIKRGREITRDGLIIGIGKCYKLSAKDNYGNSFDQFESPVDLTIKVADKEINDSGFPVSVKPNIRLYEYYGDSNSWEAVSNTIGESDSLYTQVNDISTYMLGVEFDFDETKPEFGELYPSPNSIVNTIKDISFKVNDNNGSGLEIGRVFVMLDSLNCNVSHDPETGIVIATHPELHNLDIGEHSIFIQIFDKAGNRNEISYCFELELSDTKTDTYIFPNPFNPNIINGTIWYNLTNDGNVSINIYDVSGFLVRHLIENVEQNAEISQYIEWNGKSDSGKIVANGVYFYVIESSSGEQAVGKAAILR